MDDPVKDKPYPTSDDLRACILTESREKEARRRRNQPHLNDELICALVNELDKERDYSSEMANKASQFLRERDEWQKNAEYSEKKITEFREILNQLKMDLDKYNATPITR